MEKYAYINKKNCKLLDINILKELTNDITVHFEDDTVIDSNRNNINEYYKIRRLTPLIYNNYLRTHSGCVPNMED
jgi:hypothetical protein